MDISVICPVMNAPSRLLRSAAASVLAALDAARMQGELIIIDDGSTEPATLRAMAWLAARDGRVVLRRPGANAGPASARNQGLAIARGAWLGFVDADDLWLPDRLVAARMLMVSSDVQWIGGRHVLLRPAGSEAAPSLAAAMGGGGVLCGAALTRCLLANFWMHLGAMLVRRDVARRAGGFAPGLFYGEDVLFMARLSVLAPLHWLDTDLYAWRRAGAGLTAASARLGVRSMAMHEVAARDPLLRGFTRELRWARYSALKGLAVNNLHAGRRAAATRFALRAFAQDPREGRDLWRFAALWLRGGEAHHYSLAEPFALKDNR